MKPHEETWIPEEVIVMHERHDGQKEAREVLGAAAPDLARALLRNGYVREDGLWHVDVCNELNDGSATCFESCQEARAALVKAGVLR